MEDKNLRLLFSAQRALLGEVTPGLRAVSIEGDSHIVRWRCIFESTEAKDMEWEHLSAAAAEVCADLDYRTKFDEEYLVVTPSERMQHLKHLVYFRNEEM